MPSRITRLPAGVFAALLFFMAPIALTPAHAQTAASDLLTVDPPATSLKDHVHQVVAQILDPDVGPEADWEARQKAALELKLAVAMSSDARRERQAWIEAESCEMTTRLIVTAEGSMRARLLEVVHKEPAAMREVALALYADENLSGAISVLIDLYETYGSAISTFAPLTAALCVVHDSQLAFKFDEDTVQPPSAESLFGFYVARENKLLINIRSGSPEMIAYVVDVPATIEDMQWAFSTYAGQRNLRTIMDAVRWTDQNNDAWTHTSSRPEFTLQNILAHGAGTRMRAYFGATIGKSIGVPSVWISGQHGEGLYYYWSGFLTQDRNHFKWIARNKDCENYKDIISSNTYHPRWAQEADLAFIGAEASLYSLSTEDRWLSRALIGGAYVLRNLDADPTPITIAQPRKKGAVRKLPFIAKRGAGSANKLLQTAARICPTNSALWAAVGQLGDGLDSRELVKWIGVAHKSTLREWPAYTLTATRLSLTGVTDDKIAYKVWSKVAALFKNRPDLAAQAYVQLADRAAQANDNDVAFQSYRDAVNTSKDAGAYVLTAIGRAKSFLADQGRPGMLLELTTPAWSRLKQPYLREQSKIPYTLWYRLGLLHADALSAAGKSQDARDILARINGAAGIR